MKNPHSHKSAASAPALEVCSICVGDTLFGVPIAQVIEILGVKPRAPSRWRRRSLAVWCIIAERC